MKRDARKEREGMEKFRKNGGFGTWSGFAWLFSVDGIRGLARKLFAVMVAVACAGMLGGCGESVEFKWVGRSNMSIAGFIDDSLVVAYDCRG